MFSRIALALFLCVPSVFAQRNATVPDPDPEIERKTFVLPEGFEVNLYAADPMLAKPIQMNFDSQGRLWVAASEVYPQIKPGQKANDKILILEDTKNAGKVDKVTIFADGLLIPTAVEPDQKGGAYVADSTDMVHFSAPDPKTGKATKRRIVLSGFGTEDTHHILHTFRTGPDGMLYMSQSVYIHSHIETPHGPRRLNAGGIWQFQPETEKLEVFARGWWNSWGTAWNKYGTTFATDGAGGQGINYVVPGAYYEASKDPPRILPGLNPGSPKMCGLEILSGRHLPDDWQQNLICNDFRGHRVCRFIVKEDGAGFVAQEQKELIKSTHPAFRPIDVKMGPDGAIYIADWYNPIIQHGEVDFRDERRDKTHGRIWRITYKAKPLVEKPKISGAKVEELLELLKSPEDWTRSHARRELASRGKEEVFPKLKVWIETLKDEQTKLEVLWLCQSLDIPQYYLDICLKSPSADVRAAACRVGGEWNKKRFGNANDTLQLMTKDQHPRVRLEAVRASVHIGPDVERGDSFESIAYALDKPTDRWLDYAIWLSLRETKDQWLPKVKDGSFNFGGDPKKLAFALQAAGENDISSPLVAMLNSGKTTPEEIDNILLTMANSGGAKEISIVLERCTSNQQRAKLYPVIEQSVRSRKVGLPPNNKAESLIFAIDEETGPSRQAACRLLGLWKFEGARPIIEKLASGVKLVAASSVEDRIAACEALVSLGGKKSNDFFENVIKTSTDRTTQYHAVVSLTQLNPTSAANSAIRLMSSEKDTASLDAVFTAFVARKGGTAELTKALANAKLPADVAKVGVRVAKSAGQPDNALIGALTKAGGLTDQKKAYTKDEIASILDDVKTKGDPARGEKIYRRTDMLCLKCHAIAGAGGQVGPDLSSIGASAPVDYLLESLLVPNAKIKENYNTITVTTIDDRVFSGIKIRETPQQLVIRDAEGKEVTISKADKPEIKPGRSLMADDAVSPLTRAELVDLVRFLSELGKANYLAKPDRVVRRWEQVQPTPEFYTAINRDRIGTIATNLAISWASAYSTVAGELPLVDINKWTLRKEEYVAVRFQLDVTTAGKAGLKIGDIAGLQLWLEGNPLEVKEKVQIELSQGIRTITVLVKLTDRKIPLKVELEEIANTPTRVQIVGGR